jgi:hypothetical protein
VSRGLKAAIEDLKPDRTFIVHGGEKDFPLGGGVEAITLRALSGLLRNAR